MKLLSLSIDGDYKSLSSFKYEFKSSDYDYESLEPICFVGLNGSGKSNIIEALSEIFCFLDLYCLQYSKTPRWARRSPLSFQLEYSIKKGRSNKIVLFSAEKNKTPTMSVDGDVTSEAEAISGYLPERILGYSSGHNETISLHYLRNQGFYADEIMKSAFKSDGELGVKHTKTLLMDYDSNVLILLANFIFSPVKNRQIFTDALRIKDVSSFRVVIDFAKKPTGSEVKRTNEIEETVEKLKNCALMCEQQGKLFYVLDFIVNEATRKAFKQNFSNAVDFYTRLYSNRPK